jgi:hypothetical protein
MKEQKTQEIKFYSVEKNANLVSIITSSFYLYCTFCAQGKKEIYKGYKCKYYQLNIDGNINNYLQIK